MKKRINLNSIKLLVAFILLLSFIPLLVISFYNHPSADDYNYSVYTMNILHTSGIWGILSGMFKTVKEFYFSWQGTYSAVAIMSLQPSIWGNDFYFMGTWILLFSLIFSTFIIFKNLGKLIKTNKYNSFLVAAMFLFITIQTIPSLVQGLYWWNGSSYYSLFYSFFLIEVALMISYIMNSKKSSYICLLILSFVIAGGNLIIALQQCIFLFLYSLISYIQKKDIKPTGILLVSIIGLLISALAPGNAKRQALVQGMPALKAIVMSFIEGIKHIIKWSSIENILFSILIILLV